MANTLPTTMEYFDNLLGEQLTEGGGSGGGESDFSTGEVTVNIIGGSQELKVTFDALAFLSIDLEEDETAITTNPSFRGQGSVPCVLYRGHAYATLIPPENYSITNVSTEGNVSVQDNIYVDIRGNGSITITITAD